MISSYGTDTDSVCRNADVICRTLDVTGGTETVGVAETRKIHQVSALHLNKFDAVCVIAAFK